jgi:hypothetical protein
MRARNVAIVSAVLTAMIVIVVWSTMPQGVTDEQRYAKLKRLGRTYKMAHTTRPGLPDRLAALVRFRSLTNYLHTEFEEQERALVSSGYLVEVTVPVPNLRAKRMQVKSTLSNTWVRTDAYYVATFDKTRDEIRLLCRKQDISLWQAALSTVQGE